MQTSEMPGRAGLAAVRMGVATAAGVAAGIATAISTEARYAPVAGWIAGACVYLAWTWVEVGRMTPQRTASHATREDPTQAATGVLMVAASVASLGGVGYVLMAASAHGGDAESAAGLGVGSVVVAWLIVHTVFTLRYARLYYIEPVGGIEFNESDRPAYVDFAYLAFTIGMTYQVSDTNLKTRTLRATALRQALLSYFLGAVILGTVINLIAGLGSSGH